MITGKNMKDHAEAAYGHLEESSVTQSAGRHDAKLPLMVALLFETAG